MITRKVFSDVLHIVPSYFLLVWPLGMTFERLLRLFSLRDALAPFLKPEEEPRAEIRVSPFHYVLCAATSPAAKLQDETLTYLNQGDVK